MTHDTNTIHILARRHPLPIQYARTTDADILAPVSLPGAKAKKGKGKKGKGAPFVHDHAPAISMAAAEVAAAKADAAKAKKAAKAASSAPPPATREKRARTTPKHHDEAEPKPTGSKRTRR